MSLCCGPLHTNARDWRKGFLFVILPLGDIHPQEEEVEMTTSGACADSESCCVLASSVQISMTTACLGQECGED